MAVVPALSELSSEELDASLCEYEVQRLTNIKDNKKMLKLLG